MSGARIAAHSDAGRLALVESDEVGTRRRRRRGQGEGTIYRRSDGLWVAQLVVGRRSDGKVDRRKVSAKTRNEVQRKLDDLRRQAASGTISEAAKERETIAGYLA